MKKLVSGDSEKVFYIIFKSLMDYCQTIISQAQFAAGGHFV